MQLRFGFVVIAAVALLATSALAEEDFMPERDLIEVPTADLAVGKDTASQKAMQAHLEEIRSQILPLHEQICSTEDDCADRRLENARIVEDIVERRCYRKKGCDAKAPCHKKACQVLKTLKGRHRQLQRTYNKLYRRFVLMLAKYYRKKFTILSKVFTRTVKSLRLHAHKVEQRNAQLKKQLAQVQNKRQKAENEADKLDDQNEKNKADLKDARGKHGRALAALRREKASVAALKKAIASLRGELSNSKKNHQAQAARAAKAEAKNAQGAKLAAALRAQIRALTHQLRSAGRRARGMGRITTGLARQVALLKKLLASARAGKASAAKGSVALRTELKKCRVDYGKTKNKYDDLIKKAAKARRAHASQSARTRAQLAAHKKRASTAERNLAKLKNAHKKVLAKMQREAAARRRKLQEAAARAKLGVFHRFGLSGQILAQAACQAMANSYNNMAAVRRLCNNNTPSCNSICARMGRRCITGLHIYSNQPAVRPNQIGLKTYKLNDRHSKGCGANYCCCTTGSGRHRGPAELDLEVESEDPGFAGEPDAEELETLPSNEVTFDGPTNEDDSDVEREDEEDEDEATTTDLDVAKMNQSNNYKRFSLHAQILAQAACVGMAKRGGWVFAVRRGCSGGYPACSTMCSRMREGQAGRLTAYNSLHLYQRNLFSRPQQIGIYTHRYNAVYGSCGPNYCCCSNSRQSDEEEDFELPVNEIELNLGETAEEEQADEEDEAETVEINRFERYSIDGQVEAQAACVAIAPYEHRKRGWIFAVRRSCRGGAPTCKQVCGSMGESQAGKPLYCFNALHVYGNGGFTRPHQIGLKTYRYNNCNHGGCGPNYCCCWKGNNGVRP